MSEVKRWIKTQIPSCSYNAPEYVLASDYDALKAENERLRKALQELVALVRGECPRLLDEDRDGDARLSIEIDAALSSTDRSGDKREDLTDGFQLLKAQKAREQIEPQGAEVRWVLDGKVYARPSVTDLLTEAEGDLELEGEIEFYRTDARIQSGTGFARVRDLLAGKADVKTAPFKQGASHE